MLIGLGTWQVQRLQWKNELTAAVRERLLLPPVALDDAVIDPQDYQSVRVTAEFVPELIWYRGIKTRLGVPGSHVLMVAKSGDGRYWLTELGWIADTKKDAAKVPGGSFELLGILRPSIPRGPFTPQNDFTNARIYAEELELLGERATLNLEGRVLQLSENPVHDLEIMPSSAEPDLRNNHLGYALTWYGLAAALIGVYIAFGRHSAKEAQA